MADHKDEGPAHRQRRPFGKDFASNKRCKPNPKPKHAQPDHSLRRRRPVRHVQHSLADTLVQAAIKSGNLDRLKAAILEGQFDG
jgi:hypothetical protein